MPFANYSRLVACFLKEFWHGLLASIKRVGIVHETIFMTMFPCKHTCAARSGNRIGNIAVVENQSFLGNIINIGSGCAKSVGIRTDCLTSMVVGHNVDNVERFLNFCFFFLYSAGCKQDAASYYSKCAFRGNVKFTHS